MEMTKQRKMLIGVLCTGLLGLVVDRLFLATPESAAASEESDVVIEVPAPTGLPALGSGLPTPVDNTASSELPSYASLTERLLVAQQNAVDGASNTRADPFDLPAKWQADRSKPATPTESQDTPGVSGQRLTAIFTLDGTVRSVIDEEEEIMAVISGGGLDSRAVRVGQKIRVANANGELEEFVLIEVGSRYVVWKSQMTGERIEMRVEEVL